MISRSAAVWLFNHLWGGGGWIRENSFPNFIQATIEHFKTNWWILWNSPFFFIKGHNLKGFFADLLDFLVASGEEEQRKFYIFCYRNSGIFYSVPVKFIWKLKTFFLWFNTYRYVSFDIEWYRYHCFRDYLSVKVWDLHMESKPIETFTVSYYLSGDRDSHRCTVSTKVFF